MKTACENVLEAGDFNGRPCRVYKRRWLMLFIFVLYSLSNAAQWIQYAIVANVVAKYYGVDESAVDWTSIVFMLTYTPLVLPAAVLMERVGLKKGMIIGATLSLLGAAIKCASAAPNLFYVSLGGQTLVSVAQVFTLGVPPELAARWFASSETSTACSLGVFGNMLGIACSFVVTPLLVRSNDNQQQVGRDLSLMFYTTAGFCLIVFLLIATLFQERPPLPPSPEAASRQACGAPLNPTPGQPSQRGGVLAPMRRLFSNCPFVLLMGSCAINVATFSALSTLLNQLVLTHFKDGEVFAGRLGLVVVVGSMVGSVASGVILDRTHKFKETALGLYAISVIAMLAFTFVLPMNSELYVYAAGAGVGVFMGGYMPVVFEFASELTYPESENTTAGVMLGASQLLSVAVTLGYSRLLDMCGDTWANLALSAGLVVGVVFTACVQPRLLRRAAHCKASLPSPPPTPSTPSSPSSTTSESSEVRHKLLSR